MHFAASKKTTSVYGCDGGFAKPICEFANCELKVSIVAKNANLRTCESPITGLYHGMFIHVCLYELYNRNMFTKK